MPGTAGGRAAANVGKWRRTQKRPGANGTPKSSVAPTTRKPAPVKLAAKESKAAVDKKAPAKAAAAAKAKAKPTPKTKPKAKKGSASKKP